MRTPTSRTIALAGLCAALVSGGAAFAQPPRLIPPADQFGPNPPPLNPLQMPADPAQNWLLRPDAGQSYELQMDGTLAAVAPDQLRIERGEDVPDAIVYLRPETTYYLEGRAVTPTQIPRGAPVHVIFDLEGNLRVARRVEAVRPGSEAAADLGGVTLPPVSTEIPGLRVEEEVPPTFVPTVPPIEGLQPEDVRPLPGAPAVPTGE